MSRWVFELIFLFNFSEPVEPIELNLFNKFFLFYQKFVNQE